MNDAATAVLIEEHPAPGRLTLPSLVLARVATMPATVLVSLLLVDIGLTFDQPVGVTGQLQSAFQVVGAIAAVLMGVWSVRFSHKSLLLMGLLMLSISAVGCFLALTFPMLLLCYSLSGLGLGMVEPMVLALVGAHFPPKQRGSAIGWTLTGAGLGGVISPLIIGFIVGLKFGGWRGAFLGFALPFSLLSFLFAMTGIPAPHRSSPSSVGVGTYFAGFKGILASRSATACLLGAFLSFGSWQALYLYSASLFRERFGFSAGMASLYFVGAGLCFALGSQLGGRVINRLGRKPLTIGAGTIGAFSVILFTNISHLGVAIALAYSGIILYGILLTASSSLTLEQVPQYRGSMMSIMRAAWSGGAALGISIGGLMLLRLDYNGMGLALGIFGLVAVVIYHFLARDLETLE